MGMVRAQQVAGTPFATLWHSGWQKRFSLWVRCNQPVGCGRRLILVGDGNGNGCGWYMKRGSSWNKRSSRSGSERVDAMGKCQGTPRTRTSCYFSRSLSYECLDLQCSRASKLYDSGIELRERGQLLIPGLLLSSNPVQAGMSTFSFNFRIGHPHCTFGVDESLPIWRRVVEKSRRQRRAQGSASCSGRSSSGLLALI